MALRGKYSFVYMFASHVMFQSFGFHVRGATAKTLTRFEFKSIRILGLYVMHGMLLRQIEIIFLLAHCFLDSNSSCLVLN